MGVQKHLFVIERGVIKELLKLKTNARSFTKLFFIANYVETITSAWNRIILLSSMFEGVFLECKNSSWAIVNRE